MPSIKVLPNDKVFEYEEGNTLLEILLENNIFVDNPCNGKGLCGKCKFRILEGDLQEPEETERSILKNEEWKDGIRLSCLVKPEGNLVVELLQKERKHKVLTDGYVPAFELHQDIQKKVLNIQRPTLEEQTSYEDQILRQFPGRSLNLQCLQSAELQPGQVTAVLYQETILQMEEGDTAEQLYGVAIDIGTTTVVCTLIDLRTGKEISHASMINAQKHFGLDVLTRITYELEHPEDGKEKLQKALVDSINQMLQEVCEQAAISREWIYEIVVGANCTMMHMLLGVSAASLGKSPYAPVFVKSKDILAKEIGISVAKGARLYCLPAVSSYIGADVVAGVYVCQLHKSQENIMFIDIGTNGEIVLSHKGKLLCCSCAAGPALEGMNITSGMRAADGAIEDIEISESGVQFKVIGNEKPIGICGSGIITGVKELLRTGLVRKEGAFIKLNKLDASDYRYPMLRENGKKREFVLSKEKNLFITQGDIRQVQLAKGAILSGFLALLNRAGIKMEDLDRVLIAGQFGSHLPVESLVGIGIIPEEVKEKVTYVGNSSKAGAYMALMSSEVKQEMEEISKEMDYLELGATENYERLFSECLIFPQ